MLLVIAEELIREPVESFSPLGLLYQPALLDLRFPVISEWQLPAGLQESIRLLSLACIIN